MIKLQKFQTVEFDGWATEITKRNHIDSMYPSGQQAVADFMIQVLQRNFGNSLETMLSKYDTKWFDTDDEYYIDVLGNARRNVPLAEARYYNGEPVDEANAGVNGEPFYLVFNEMWFFDGEIIYGELNEVYPFRITGKPIVEGTKYVYLVELANGTTTGVPVDRLQPGERFSYGFAPVERGLSKEVGGIRHSTPARLRNEFTTIRIHDEVSGDVYGKKIAMGVPTVDTDKSGKQVKSVTNMWMHMWEYTFEKTWREYKNNLYAYAASNRNEYGEYMNFGKSGEVIRIGDGLYNQLRRGNTHYYNHFSLNLLEDVMMKISVDKLEENQRQFTIATGEFGRMDFSKAVQWATAGWTPYVYNGDQLSVIKKNAGLNSYTATQPQFTGYIGPNGFKVDVITMAHYDDPVNNKIDYPGGKGKAMSHRYDIWLETTGGKSNIFKAGIKGQPTEARSIQWGIRDPYTGRWGNPYMSFPDDKAVIHKMGQFGVGVLDPTKCVALIPSILQDVSAGL